MAKEKDAAPDPDAPEGDGDGRRKLTIPIESKAIPAGVKAVLKLKPWRDAQEYSAYIYQVTRTDPARPGKETRKYLERVYNTEIEESYLQARFPKGGRFRVMYQVPAQEKGGDAEIYTDDYEIEAVAAASSVAPGGAAPPVPAQAGMGDHGGRRVMLSELREMVELVNLLRPPADQVTAAAGPAWLERMYRDKIERVNELEERLQRRLGGQGVAVHSENGNGGGAGAGDNWPEFIRPYVPALKQFGIDTLQTLAGKLLGGGIEGGALRMLVTNNPAFRALWSDVEKRNAAAAAIITHLGEAGENLVTLFQQQMEGPQQ